MTEWQDPINEFNSLKMLIHVPEWRRIQAGECVYPVFVALDPCGSCNLHCSWCNSQPALGNHQWSKADIDLVIHTLVRWNTRAVCIGGGGEPTLCNEFGYLIEQLHQAQIATGLVTNGTALLRHEGVLPLIGWVGVSVDAACEETYENIKKVKLFEGVMNAVASCARLTTTEYKFLLCPENCREIETAAILARNLGCHIFHCRPGQTPWWDLKQGWMHYSGEDVIAIRTASEHVMAMTGIKVACVTHKFNTDLTPARRFSSCHACLTQCLISPTLDVGLCVCRRGDQSTILGNLKENGNFQWLSDRHRDLVAGINVAKCPHCSQSPINELWERMVLRDDMGSDFF